MEIRLEEKVDEKQIFEINKQVFHDGEEFIVNKLRSTTKDFLCLVAVEGSEVLGYILFTSVYLSVEPKPESPLLMGLAPLAVKKNAQGKGIGSLLIEKGFEACRKKEVAAVFVLGHKDYYKKFGFTPAYEENITCEYKNAPKDSFLVREFQEGSVHKIQNSVIYFHPLFREVIPS